MDRTGPSQGCLRGRVCHVPHVRPSSRCRGRSGSRGRGSSAPLAACQSQDASAAYVVVWREESERERARASAISSNATYVVAWPCWCRNLLTGGIVRIEGIPAMEAGPPSDKSFCRRSSRRK